MDFVVVILAFFFALIMCLGLILMKWIITQVGATIFFMVLFLMIAVCLLVRGDIEDDE